jgi:ribonuclease HII
MSKSKTLLPYYHKETKYEIALDEAGRGPMFGRLYVAAVILPKDDTFDHSQMKDSKKFHSKKKIAEVAEYIKKNSITWHIHWIEAETIDKINIRQAVLQGMHECVKKCMEKIGSPLPLDCFILVDGNDFVPYMVFNETTESLEQIQFKTIEGGDNTYSAIAAASILAKTARDAYILDLCSRFPELKTKYSIDTNMGYGTKVHMNAIKEHGISQWHRKTYGICRTSNLVPLP